MAAAEEAIHLTWSGVGGDDRERWAMLGGEDFFVCRLKVDCRLRASFSEKMPRLSYFIRGTINRKPERSSVRLVLSRDFSA
eukprot:scaffold162752_cov36-Cyclotella_meneghiniana.AAC.1